MSKTRDFSQDDRLRRIRNHQSLCLHTDANVENARDTNRYWNSTETE